MKKFEEAMTPAEKAQLYKAIDYQENAAPAQYPIGFIDTTCTFILRKLEIELKDNELKNPRVLNSELKGVKCRIDLRSAGAALKYVGTFELTLTFFVTHCDFRVAANVDELSTFGLEQDDFLPQLISSNVQKESAALLDIIFETNPLDGSCGQRLHLTTKPIRIIYDAQTIIKVTDIFQAPESSALEKYSLVCLYFLTFID